MPLDSPFQTIYKTDLQKRIGRDMEVGRFMNITFVTYTFLLYKHAHFLGEPGKEIEITTIQ